MPLSALLFDFDGTLADTARAHVEAWYRTFGEAGLTVSRAECGAAAEVEDSRFATELLERHGCDPREVEALVRRKFAIGLKELARTARLYPGAAELVRSLAGRYRLALVSSTWRENVEAVLGSGGLSPFFQVIVGKADLAPARRKPQPDPYFLAARQLGLDPRLCLAVEDALDGIRSAQAAGIRCLAVAHRHSAAELAEANWVLPSLLDHAGFDQILALAGSC